MVGQSQAQLFHVSVEPVGQMGVGIAHVADGGQPEEEQRQGEEQIGTQPHHHGPQPVPHALLGPLPLGLEKCFVDDDEALEQSVCGKRPSGTVPHTDGHKRDEQRQAESRASHAAQRGVEWGKHVVAHPERERHVPSPPQFARGLREERPVEVGLQVEAQHASQSESHAGVAGKIGVELDGVEQGGHQNLHARSLPHLVENAVERRPDAVGNDEFEEAAPAQEFQSACHFHIVEPTAGLQLWQQVVGPFDGA